jgi:hypothetical protein
MMKNFENDLKNIVNSVRFDDKPSETHRRQLEEQILEAYDHRVTARSAPSGIFYLKRVAIAASFVIAAGLLFMFFDGNGAAPNGHPAHSPDPQTVEQILQQEKVSVAQRQALLSEIQQVWKLIAAEDVTALTEVVLDGQVASSIRLWAGETVVKLGDEQTLGMLEKHIEEQGLTDTEDPVVQTDRRLRERLETKPDK